jgi:hypothetical protein
MHPKREALKRMSVAKDRIRFVVSGTAMPLYDDRITNPTRQATLTFFDVQEPSVTLGSFRKSEMMTNEEI